MEFIRQHIEEFSIISDSDWEYFSSKLVHRIFKKHTVFLKYGAVENHISFIDKGVVRLYIPKELKEKEVTFGFSFNQRLEVGVLPKRLTNLTFGWSFNQPLEVEVLPKSLII